MGRDFGISTVDQDDLAIAIIRLREVSVWKGLGESPSTGSRMKAENGWLRGGGSTAADEKKEQWEQVGWVTKQKLHWIPRNQSWRFVFIRETY